MTMTLSRVIQALEPSATMAMAAKAKELKASGKVVYDLSLGEPDFHTPKHICDAAAEAMRSGHTHYTPASGIPELKKAVAEQYGAAYGLHYDPAQVVVANGAKHALHNVFTALLDPGDEVVIPAPYWVSSPSCSGEYMVPVGLLGLHKSSILVRSVSASRSCSTVSRKSSS